MKRCARRSPKPKVSSSTWSIRSYLPLKSRSSKSLRTPSDARARSSISRSTPSAWTRSTSRSRPMTVCTSRITDGPTCLYLALTFGIYAANYPLTEEELDEPRLPSALKSQHARLFGLSIDPGRLHQIRRERKAEGSYATLKRCQYETAQAEALFRA